MERRNATQDTATLLTQYACVMAATGNGTDAIESQVGEPGICRSDQSTLLTESDGLNNAECGHETWYRDRHPLLLPQSSTGLLVKWAQTMDVRLYKCGLNQVIPNTGTNAGKGERGK
jgi:hypothetical protein